MLGAGLEGIEKEYSLPPPTQRNVFGMSETDRRASGIEMLPGSLNEAIQIAETSDLLRRCLGEHLFESVLRNKRIEWEDYSSHVSDYELQRYLPIL
jgi:glutamine synthetase